MGLRDKKTHVDCGKENGKLKCKVKRGGDKGEFKIGVNKGGKPEMTDFKGPIELIKNVKEDVKDIVRVKGVEGASREF